MRTGPNIEVMIKYYVISDDVMEQLLMTSWDVPWGNIMIHVGDIMRTMGGVQYRRGTQITKNDIPRGTEHPLTVLKISPHSS